MINTRTRWTTLACRILSCPVLIFSLLFLIRYQYYNLIMDDSKKENETHYHSWKEHLKMNKIAKFGCQLL
jgi:hypothetical protein